MCLCSGEQAKKWNVVQHTSSGGAENVVQSAIDLACTIAKGGPLGVAGAKRVIDAIGLQLPVLPCPSDCHHNSEYAMHTLRR